MSRTKHSKDTRGKEYWKSRLKPHGEVPGAFTKKRTHKKERQEAKEALRCHG